MQNPCANNLKIHAISNGTTWLLTDLVLQPTEKVGIVTHKVESVHKILAISTSTTPLDGECVLFPAPSSFPNIKHTMRLLDLLKQSENHLESPLPYYGEPTTEFIVGSSTPAKKSYGTNPAQ